MTLALALINRIVVESRLNTRKKICHTKFEIDRVKKLLCTPSCIVTKPIDWSMILLKQIKHTLTNSYGIGKIYLVC